jgi:hypothetical protein
MLLGKTKRMPTYTALLTYGFNLVQDLPHSTFFGVLYENKPAKLTVPSFQKNVSCLV